MPPIGYSAILNRTWQMDAVSTTYRCILQLRKDGSGGNVQGMQCTKCGARNTARTNLDATMETPIEMQCEEQEANMVPMGQID